MKISPERILLICCKFHVVLQWMIWFSNSKQSSKQRLSLLSEIEQRVGVAFAYPLHIAGYSPKRSSLKLHSKPQVTVYSAGADRVRKGLWEAVCLWSSRWGWTDLMHSLSTGFSSLLPSFPFFFSLFFCFLLLSFCSSTVGGLLCSWPSFRSWRCKKMLSRILHSGDGSHKIQECIYKQDNIRSWQ